MNKIIGLICSFAAEDWIDLSIKQALNICDDVICNFDPYTKALSIHEDNTKERAKKYPVKIVDGVVTGIHSSSKAPTLNKMIDISDYGEPGDWVWMFDVDEYYLEEDIIKIKEAMFSGDYNYIQFDEKYFFINMKKHLKNLRGRIWKISEKGNRFIPTNKWTGPQDKVYKLDGHGMFHYSLLCNPYSKIDLWKTEHWSIPNQAHPLADWMQKIYLNFDLKDEEKWILENEKLYGKKTPFWIGDMWADDNGHLFNYDGKHPYVIEEAGLPLIKDFRSLYAPRY